jgi:hypothetical protein
LFTAQPSDTYDHLLDASDEAIGRLRRDYLLLDAAIGSENFHELRDGTSPNTYNVALIIPSLKGCQDIKNYADLIIQALKGIGSSALESFSVVFPVFNETTGDYEEQVHFTHNFQENN